MRIGNWQFVPKLWPGIVTLLIFPVLVLLGFWQLDRADQKRALYQQFAEHQSESAVDLNLDKATREDKNRIIWRTVNVTGQFDTGINILLDNQIMNGKAGYFVITPFKLSGEDTRVLVNRGWVSAGSDRTVLPSISTPVEAVMINGEAGDVPVTGLFLGESPIEALQEKFYRAQRIDIAEIAGLLKHDLLPFIIRLGPESDHGFIRAWSAPGSGEEKHLGYAFQWFALAATLLIIFLIVNTKKIPQKHD